MGIVAAAVVCLWPSRVWDLVGLRISDNSDLEPKPDSRLLHRSSLWLEKRWKTDQKLL